MRETSECTEPVVEAHEELVECDHEIAQLVVDGGDRQRASKVVRGRLSRGADRILERARTPPAQHHGGRDGRHQSERGCDRHRAEDQLGCLALERIALCDIRVRVVDRDEHERARGEQDERHQRARDRTDEESAPDRSAWHHAPSRAR